MDKVSDSLQQMYDLGYKHGYEMRLRDAKIERLSKEIEEIENE
jgi:hypothetical protein